MKRFVVSQEDVVARVVSVLVDDGKHIRGDQSPVSRRQLSAGWPVSKLEDTTMDGRLSSRHSQSMACWVKATAALTILVSDTPGRLMQRSWKPLHVYHFQHSSEERCASLVFFH